MPFKASIAAFRHLVSDSRSALAPVVQQPAISGWTTSVDVTGTAAHTDTLPPSATLVRVNVPHACHVAIGVDAVATTEDMRMSAGQTEYFGVDEGSAMRLSFIAVDED